MTFLDSFIATLLSMRFTLKQFSFSNHYDFSADGYINMIAFFFRSQIKQRWPAYFMALLYPNINFTCPEVAMLDKITRQTAVPTSCGWVLRNAIVIPKD